MEYLSPLDLKGVKGCEGHVREGREANTEKVQKGCAPPRGWMRSSHKGFSNNGSFSYFWLHGYPRTVAHSVRNLASTRPTAETLIPKP